MAAAALTRRPWSVRTAGAGLTLGLLLVLLTGCLPARERAVAIWVVSGDEQLTHDTPPVSESDAWSASAGRVRLTAALNEAVAFQLALRTTAPPAGPFEVMVSDLTGPTDVLSAHNAVSIYRVQYTRVERFRSWYPLRTGQPAVPTLFPDALVPWDATRGGGPLTLTEPRNEIVWVDVQVPPTISAGLYRGRVTVRHTMTSVPVFACDVELEVLPIALPGRRSLPVLCRLDPRDLLTAHVRWPRTTAEQTRILPTMPGHAPAVELMNESVRLFHSHRTAPVLWAAFPKYRPGDSRHVEIDWEDYDRLVAGWLDGTAFADRVRLEHWPLPTSLTYPDAERNGGFDSPQYARLLSAYLRACREHFDARGWTARGFVRLIPPMPLTQDVVDQYRGLAGIVAQSETSWPLVAHLPTRTLRGLGWLGAPSIELTGINTWAPSALWCEPEAIGGARSLGSTVWLLPDQPPYAGALAVEAPLTDVWCLPWLAYRYGLDGLWVEHAVDRDLPPGEFGIGDPLVYPGEPGAGPLPTLRLKRLRRGLQDYELLKLLEANGQTALAQTLAQQVVRWGLTDACLDNLLAPRAIGWPSDPAILRRARTLIMRELCRTFEPGPDTRSDEIATLSDWLLMFNQADRVAVRADGVRLVGGGPSLRAEAWVSVTNTTNRQLTGRWRGDGAPEGWSLVEEVTAAIPAGGRRSARLLFDIAALSYNTDGVYPFQVVLDTDAIGAFARPARLAVAACPARDTPPTIDGVLNDWPLASNNTASDFRLCRVPDAAVDRPSMPTRAFFGLDREHLYVAVRCGLGADEPPLWRADNVVPLDGSIPWGQDVVEILIDPRPIAAGTVGDVYCLQIKPSGVILARRGCLTDPPMGPSEPWSSGARVAVSMEREAWVIELALPLDAFNPAARRNPLWGFNVTRLDARRGEYSSWSGARGTCYLPHTLGNLFMLWP